jgi:hypothetical protein
MLLLKSTDGAAILFIGIAVPSLPSIFVFHEDKTDTLQRTGSTIGVAAGGERAARRCQRWPWLQGGCLPVLQR